MHEDHRIRNGLNEWNKLPAGYHKLDTWDRIEPGDVQQLNPQHFAEYPANGFLVGRFVGTGRWYRANKEKPPQGRL